MVCACTHACSLTIPESLGWSMSHMPHEREYRLQRPYSREQPSRRRLAERSLPGQSPGTWRPCGRGRGRGRPGSWQLL